MKSKKFLLAATLLFASHLSAQDSKTEETLLEKRIPAWVKPVLAKPELKNSYTISDTINPFYLEADFNGDKLEDIAFYIVSKVDGKAGVLIVHRQTNVHFIIGAGKDFGMGDHMSWVKIWSVHREKSIRSFTSEKTQIALKYPAIRIVKSEEISAYFYWTGKKYKTFNQLY